MGTDMETYRVEDKFCCGVQEMYQLQRRLDAVLLTDGYGNGTGGYTVSSLYFDDFMDSCLADTEAGSNRRRKYRIRIYNRSLDVIKLEIKEKRDNRVCKRTKRISAGEMERLKSGQCIADEGTGQDPAFLFNLAIRTRGLLPKVIVTYERMAYLYAPGNVRITFDRNVRAGQRVEEFGKEVFHDFNREEDAVLELKYDAFLPSFIPQLLEQNSLRQTAFSKYRICRNGYRV